MQAGRDFWTRMGKGVMVSCQQRDWKREEHQETTGPQEHTENTFLEVESRGEAELRVESVAAWGLDVSWSSLQTLKRAHTYLFRSLP